MPRKPAKAKSPSRRTWRRRVEPWYLARAHLRWGDHVAKLITQRCPCTEFETALGQHPSDEIKAVVEWEV